ncbi:hypothetical protein EG327_002123 [Venturia inaequalis]|uniref:Uncharacterized protein n=1 Tax=Venturia inaequalis TaxID=5025 RepID=A0A8H3ZF54_VENIN|nr:hypothetical protein EG327_002123 [Venturia inaequalis]
MPPSGVAQDCVSFGHSHHTVPRPVPESLSSRTQAISFLSLPRELRQAILIYTCEGDNALDACDCRHRKFRKSWLATLREVNVQFLEDITYVEDNWSRRLDAKALLWQTSGYPLFDYWNPFKIVDFRTQAQIIGDLPPSKKRGAKGRFCRSNRLLRCADRFHGAWMTDSAARTREVQEHVPAGTPESIKPQDHS